MSIIASIHGRAGTDPVPSTTQSGKDMTRLSVAIDVTGTNAEAEETVWVSVFAFGRMGEELARAQKGETVTAQGRLTRGRYTGRDGQERESWALTADAVLVAASARPAGRRSASRT
jgi:single-strand DNA-binding protein